MIEKIKAKELRPEHLGHTISLTKAGVNDVPHRFYLAQITFGYDGRPRPGPIILLKGGDMVVYRADPWDRVEVERMPDPPAVVVVRDEDGAITDLRCPNPSCAVSDIAEVDQSTRWNRLEVDDGQIGVILSDNNNVHVGWVCQHCGWDLTSDLDPDSLVYS